MLHYDTSIALLMTKLGFTVHIITETSTKKVGFAIIGTLKGFPLASAVKAFKKALFFAHCSTCIL